MKKSISVLLPGFLLACLISITQAAEEQIVIEDLSLTQLRTEIGKIQHEVYRVFNILNTDEELEITCSDYMPIGSNIRQEACEPKFLIDERAENASNWQFQGGELLTSDQLQRGLSVQFEELTAAMNDAAEVNQYFKELTTILRVLNERLVEITG